MSRTKSVLRRRMYLAECIKFAPCSLYYTVVTSRSDAKNKNKKKTRCGSDHYGACSMHVCLDVKDNAPCGVRQNHSARVQCNGECRHVCGCFAPLYPTTATASDSSEEVWQLPTQIGGAHRVAVLTNIMRYLRCVSSSVVPLPAACVSKTSTPRHLCDLSVHGAISFVSLGTASRTSNSSKFLPYFQKRM